MSKKQEAKQELAVVNEGNKNVAIPQNFMAGVAQFAEESKSDFTADDVITPSLRIIQGLSPQRQKNEQAYIEGAEEGHIFNTASNELYDGGVGIIVIPCFYSREWVEWKPRKKGGGLVKKWSKDESFKTTGEYVDVKGRWVKKDAKGEEESGIILTANYCVLLVNLKTMLAKPCMIRLSSTEFKKSRKWNSLIDQTEICSPDGTPCLKKDGSPIAGNEIPFWYMYHLTTVPESNDSGNWFGFKIEKYKPLYEMPNCHILMEQAKDFRLLGMEGNIKTIEQAPEDEAGNDDPNKV